VYVCVCMFVCVVCVCMCVCMFVLCVCMCVCVCAYELECLNTCKYLYLLRLLRNVHCAFTAPITPIPETIYLNKNRLGDYIRINI
jgi:hypothetical protein